LSSFLVPWSEPRMKRLLATLVILGLLFAGFVVFLPGQATAQTTRHGGWADSIVWSLQGDSSQATAAMDTGALNMWLYYYNTPQLLTAGQNDPNIGLLTVAGSTEDMLFNPASTNVTASATIFNPFAVRAVRTAMNYLVDRSYIAREIYGGAAFPMTAVESSQTPEFARDPVYFASLEAKYPYSPSRASSMVTDAMSRVTDVTFASAKWNYKGTPIVIKLLARVEDQRHQIGDYSPGSTRAWRRDNLSSRRPRTWASRTASACGSPRARPSRTARRRLPPSCTTSREPRGRCSPRGTLGSSIRRRASQSPEGRSTSGTGFSSCPPGSRGVPRGSASCTTSRPTMTSRTPECSRT